MRNAFFLLAIGFWASFIFSDSFIFLSFGLVYGFFLLIRLRKSWIIIWCVLLLASFVLQKVPDEAKLGLYKIEMIKENYCIAKHKEFKIVLYGLENVSYGNQVQVKSIEKIHTISNLGLFSFQSYLNGQGIYYSSDVSDKDILDDNVDLRGRLYQWVKKRDQYGLYRLFLYNISTEEIKQIIPSLGLPFLSSVYFLESILKKHFRHKHVQWFLLAYMAVYGSLFVITPSLLRLFLFRGFRLFEKDWMKSFSLSLIVFLFLKSDQATSFALVFPALASLIYHFTDDIWRRMIRMRLILIFCQWIYFQTVDLALLIGFQSLRKLAACIWLVLMISLFLPLQSLGMGVYSIYETFLTLFPSWSWIYVPSLIYSVLVFVLFGKMMVNKSSVWLCVALLVWPFLSCRVDPFFHVYQLDIGQGDCMLIQEPFSKSAVMIDCGQNIGRDNVQEIILPFLKTRHINSLDALIVTHEDFDHSGGKESLLKEIEIKQVITNKHQEVDVDYPFKILLQDYIGKDENENSLITYYAYDHLSYLWTGDAGINTEMELLRNYDVKADVLKLGHHGSKSSSSKAFLAAVDPKVAIISAGYQNRYGHPHAQVLSNCKQLGIDVLQTNVDGMIHIFSFGPFAFFETASGLIGSLN